MNKTKVRDAKMLSSLDVIYGKELKPYYIELADKMSEQNLLQAVNAVSNYQLNSNIQLNQTKIIAFHGTAMEEIIAKKSAKYLKKCIPDAYVKIFKGYHHGELSVNRSDEFIHVIEQYVPDFLS